MDYTNGPAKLTELSWGFCFLVHSWLGVIIRRNPIRAHLRQRDNDKVAVALIEEVGPERAGPPCPRQGSPSAGMKTIPQP